jgi:hypothetical protein
MRQVFLAGLVLAIVAIAGGPALAKSARCYTTDDGYYNCRFNSIDEQGSFEISARGYATFTLVIDRPGFAWGYADYEGNGDGTPLPGMFVRQRDDGACWKNPETDTEICAW